MKLKSVLTLAVYAVALLCLPALVYAQGDPGPDPDPIPFDGGLSMLIAAGVAYGAKKAYDKRKKDKAANEEKISE
jgi:hypothetical protein